VLWRCWLDGRKGIRPVKNMGRRWRWALDSADGVAPSRMVGVSASINLPLHHKVQKFLSGTGSPGWSRKKGHKMVVVWCGNHSDEKQTVWKTINDLYQVACPHQHWQGWTSTCQIQTAPVWRYSATQESRHGRSVTGTHLDQFSAGGRRVSQVGWLHYNLCLWSVADKRAVWTFSFISMSWITVDRHWYYLSMRRVNCYCTF